MAVSSVQFTLYTGWFVEHTLNYTLYRLTAVFEQDVHYAALKESISSFDFWTFQHIYSKILM